MWSIPPRMADPSGLTPSPPWTPAAPLLAHAIRSSAAHHTPIDVDGWCCLPNTIPLNVDLDTSRPPWELSRLFILARPPHVMLALDPAPPTPRPTRTSDPDLVPGTAETARTNSSFGTNEPNTHPTETNPTSGTSSKLHERIPSSARTSPSASHQNKPKRHHRNCTNEFPPGTNEPKRRPPQASRETNPSPDPLPPRPSPFALAALGLPARRGTSSTIRRSTPRSLPPCLRAGAFAALGTEQALDRPRALADS